MQLSTKVSHQQLNTASGNSVATLRFTGDISSGSRDVVVGSYTALSQSAKERILLDFAGVEYLNSSGIALVIEVLMEAKKAAQIVAICGLTPHFVKVFTMVGITRYATIYTNEAAALAVL